MDKGVVTAQEYDILADRTSIFDSKDVFMTWDKDSLIATLMGKATAQRTILGEGVDTKMLDPKEPKNSITTTFLM